jgi:hypothetical protein
MSDEPKISGRYRELPREQPPRALDDAILAASRRAVQARPAPLVAPTGRRRWYVPVAAAAVITLSVAVTLHVQRDRPSEEVDAVAPSMKVQEAPPPKAAEPARAERRTPQPFAAAPPAPAEAEQRNDVGAASAGARVMRDERSREQTQMARSSVAQSPEAELERIARLRAAGRHEEADKALAEFRKRYPDYRLSDEMKAKLEKRQ